MPEHTESRATHGSDAQRAELEPLQSWFQAEVVRPWEKTPSKGVAPAKAAAKEWVLPSRTLAARERVAIYARMYRLRMLEALHTDYPALARLSGDDGFERLARAYLRAHPSRHPSLNFLGRKLPEFLATKGGLSRRALLADVATLENAMSEVFDAPRETSLSSADFARLTPEQWTSARLRLPQAFRLLALKHAANAIVTAVRQQQALPDLRKKRTWVAVYRKDFVVWRMDLNEPMHAALAALRDGATLQDALIAAAGVFDGSPQELALEVRRWFGEWTAEGFFAAVES
ncbi:MAG: putative DNA-binding domain-containing protein [Planctomycetota bacterium]